MRKSIILSLAVLAVMAFTVMPVLSGESCSDVTAKVGATKAACTASEKAACTASEKANATAAGAKSCAGHGTDATTASAHGCDYDGKCEMVTINVKGMTCAGCENGLTTALQGTDGVIKVQKVSHKENLAVVCIDPTKCKSEGLTKLIASKGYDAQIMPAVATNANATMTGDKAGCTTMSKEDCSKVCGEKAAAACASKKTEEKAKSDGSL